MVQTGFLRRWKKTSLTLQVDMYLPIYLHLTLLVDIYLPTHLPTSLPTYSAISHLTGRRVALTISGITDIRVSDRHLRRRLYIYTHTYIHTYIHTEWVCKGTTSTPLLPAYLPTYPRYLPTYHTYLPTYLPTYLTYLPTYPRNLPTYPRYLPTIPTYLPTSSAVIFTPSKLRCNCQTIVSFPLTSNVAKPHWVPFCTANHEGASWWVGR